MGDLSRSSFIETEMIGSFNWPPDDDVGILTGVEKLVVRVLGDFPIKFHIRFFNDPFVGVDVDITEVEAVEPVAVVTDVLSITELFTTKQLDCVAKASSPFPDEAELDAWVSLDIDSVVLDGEDLKEE